MLTVHTFERERMIMIASTRRYNSLMLMLLAVGMVCYNSSNSGCWAFQPRRFPTVSSARITVGTRSTTTTTRLWLASNKNKDNNKDVSRSGNRQERLNKLAELEESRVETDKGFVLQAAGGFVAFLVLLLAVAYASGLLYQL